jgi:hypothetical protein
MACLWSRCRSDTTLRLSGVDRDRGCGFSRCALESSASHGRCRSSSRSYGRRVDRGFSPLPYRSVRPLFVTLARCARPDCFRCTGQRHRERHSWSFGSICNPPTRVFLTRFCLADLLAWRQHGRTSGSASCVNCPRSPEDSSSGSHRRICCPPAAPHGDVFYRLW